MEQLIANLTLGFGVALTLMLGMLISTLATLL